MLLLWFSCYASNLGVIPRLSTSFRSASLKIKLHNLNDLLHAASGATGVLVPSGYPGQVECDSCGLGLHAATSNSTGSPFFHLTDVISLLSEVGFDISQSALLCSSGPATV